MPFAYKIIKNGFGWGKGKKTSTQISTRNYEFTYATMYRMFQSLIESNRSIDRVKYLCSNGQNGFGSIKIYNLCITHTSFKLHFEFNHHLVKRLLFFLFRPPCAVITSNYRVYELNERKKKKIRSVEKPTMLLNHYLFTHSLCCIKYNLRFMHYIYIQFLAWTFSCRTLSCTRQAAAEKPFWIYFMIIYMSFGT